MLKAKKPNLITTMDSFSIKESKEIEIIVFFIISNKWSLGGGTRHVIFVISMCQTTIGVGGIRF
jgi:hypothetical protein